MAPMIKSKKTISTSIDQSPSRRDCRTRYRHKIPQPRSHRTRTVAPRTIPLTAAPRRGNVGAGVGVVESGATAIKTGGLCMTKRLVWLRLVLALLVVPISASASATTQGDGTDVDSTPSATVAVPVTGETILPKYRILSYYGFPGN